MDNGWLVGFNHGEFGAALYWFSGDGKHHYKISNDQIVAFFALPDGIYAIQGLSHMGFSCGSIITISRPTKAAHWQAFRFVRLPFAPRTLVIRRDGTLLVTLSDSLVAVSPERRIDTLISDAPWSGLYPASSILLPDESRLYIGMRQFVGEVDLTTNQLRLLVPSLEFLNKLPQDMEKTLRTQSAHGIEEYHQPVGICEEMEKTLRGNVR